MRILRLKLAGFGPYRAEQEVDFERFADDGIFLITGKTGAGKSSILDAVCYALYASVPRFERAEQRLRSDHCAPDDPTFVELEFSVGSQIYRVRRSPEFERPKKVGSGTTTAVATAELARRDGDSWEVLYAKPAEVGPEVIRIVGLSKDQFLQVVLLAQNRFQQFLRASNDDRQEVLRSLFGTARFSRIEAILGERRKALEGLLSTSRGALDQLAAQARAVLATEGESLDLEWFEAGEASLRASLLTADAEVLATTTASVTAEAEFARLSEVRRRQRERAEATSQLDALTDAAADIDALRRLVEEAQRAAIVWPRVAARRTAEHDLSAARESETVARESFDTATLGDPEVFVDEAARQLGSLQDLIVEEARLPGLRRELAALESATTKLDAAIAAATAAAAALPDEIDAATAALSVNRLIAAGEPSAAADVERATARSTAITDVARVSGELDLARRAETGASTSHATAALRLSQLMQQRLDGHAAELASGLIPGDACPVCGSTSHPALATSDAEPVTQADIDGAHSEVDVLKSELDAATDARAALDVTLADATARTDGRDAAASEGELAAAREALRAAEAASALLVPAERELERMRSALEQAITTRADLESRRSEIAVESGTKSAAAEGIDARVESQRDGFASVSARAAHLEQLVARAKALIAAITAVATSEKAESDADALLAAALVESGFVDEPSAVAARREQVELERTSARIRSHDDDRAGARVLLAQNTNVPDEPIDLTLASETLTAARSSRDTALNAQSVLTERVAGIERIVRAARERFAASAQLAAEFEQVRELAQAVAGNEPNTKRMRLETYVLAAQLEQIVAAANARLRTMTSGRFSLEHDDSVQYRNVRSGLGLAILDAHTGRARATHSLSGGETFLASLALALGLAEVVTNQAGGITLDTLFIDEGFGSLDGDTLEIAMSTLDGLREGGRTIGLISHVDSMKEQLLAQLRITVGPQGDSTIVAQGA